MNLQQTIRRILREDSRVYDYDPDRNTVPFDERLTFDVDKLLRVGAVFITPAIDGDPKSETYKKWFGVKLSEDNMKMMFVPKGFAHGFVTLSDVAVFHYKCDELYMPSADGGIIYNDPEINIDWGVDVSQLIMSDKDRVLPKLADIETDLGF